MKAFCFISAFTTVFATSVYTACVLPIAHEVDFSLILFMVVLWVISICWALMIMLPVCRKSESPITQEQPSK